MTEDELKAAIADAETKAEAKGFADAHARFTAVTASEHYAGREALAHKLLGNAKLGADEIIETLSAAEKKAVPEALDPEAVAAAAEEAARAEMRAELAKNKNSDIDPNGGGGQSAEAPANLMKAAHAKAKERRGRFS